MPTTTPALFALTSSLMLFAFVFDLCAPDAPPPPPPSTPRPDETILVWHNGPAEYRHGRVPGPICYIDGAHKLHCDRSPPDRTAFDMDVQDVLVDRYGAQCVLTVDGDVLCSDNENNRKKYRQKQQISKFAKTEQYDDIDKMENYYAISNRGAMVWGDMWRNTPRGDVLPAAIRDARGVVEVALSDSGRSPEGCLLLGSGKVTCWPGPSSMNQDPLDALAVEGLPPVASLAADIEKTCALTRDGDVYCWRSEYKTVPAPEEDRRAITPFPFADAAELSSARGRVCARRADGEVWCWGPPLPGESVGAQPLPDTGEVAARRIADLPPATRLLGGNDFVCGVDANARLTCVGNNDRRFDNDGADLHARLRHAGLPITAPAPIPPFPNLAESGAVLSAIPARRAMAAEDLLCVQPNPRKPWLCLGGTDDAAWMPRDVEAAVRWHDHLTNTCYRRASGEVSCLRERHEAPGERYTPIPRLRGARSMVATRQQACAILNGEVLCWLLTDRAPPRFTSVEGLTDPVDLAAGDEFFCAAQANGEVRCWRDSAPERTLAGWHDYPAGPFRVDGISNATELAATADLLCARQDDGAVACLRLSRSSPRTIRAPGPVEKVSGVHDAVALDTGLRRACALERDGDLKCWTFGTVALWAGAHLRSRPDPDTPPHRLGRFPGTTTLKTSAFATCVSGPGLGWRCVGGCDEVPKHHSVLCDETPLLR